MGWANIIRSASARGGFWEILRVLTWGLYARTIRRMMPSRGFVVYNGVTVALEKKALDALLPETWRRVDIRDHPEYESGLVSGLRQHVREGDRVVVVGGGFGVSTVVSAKAVGTHGKVITYEQSARSVRKVLWAAERAGCTDVLQVIRARVEHRVPGTSDGITEVVAPEDLPECDILELDCEGAEIGILRNMTVRPRAILVESHGMLGSSSADVRTALRDVGYEVVSEQVAESFFAELCSEKDIMVLEAVRQ